MPSLMPNGKQQFFDASGKPLVGGKVFTYQAGSNTPMSTFSDAAGTVANPNPIVLDARGEALVYWSGAYKVAVQDALGNNVYSVDNYTDTGSQLGSALTPFQLDDYAALRSYAGSNKIVTITGYLATSAPSGIVGNFVRDDNDTTSVDNGATTIVTSGGKRFKRVYYGEIDPRWFGAKCDGATDDTSAIQAAINYVGSGVPVSILFPCKGSVKVSGTLYVPPMCAINLNGSVITGIGTNTVFETGYWSAGAVVSNFAQANESQICYGSSIVNGQITNADRAFHLSNFCEASRIHGIRCTSVNQALYAKRCFYGSFTGIISRSPLVNNKYPCFHLDDAVNAITLGTDFAVGYTTGWKFSGAKDTIITSGPCGAESCTTGVSIFDATSAIQFRGWYFENDTTALSFDGGGTHENVVVDGCWFNTTTTAISGSSIGSGRFCATNKLNGAALSLGTNYSNRLTVEIPSDIVANTDTGGIPAGYTLGDAANVSLIRSVYDSGSGAVAKKGTIHSGAIPFERSGDSGAEIAGAIPFSSGTLTATTLTLDTRIRYRDTAMVGAVIIVQDGTPQIINLLAFGLITMSLAKPAAMTVTLSNNAGYLRIVIGGFTAATSYSGDVRHL